MFLIIIISIVVGILLYSTFVMDFELGTGYTEEKKKIREVEYRVVPKEETDSSEGDLLLK